MANSTLKLRKFRAPAEQHRKYIALKQKQRFTGPSNPMLSIIKKLQHQIESITHFLTPLLPLANCHMVDFLTENHWETLVPEKLRTVLDDWDLFYAVDKFWEHAESSCQKDTTELSNWITAARGHCLTVNDEYCLSKDQLQDRITSWGGVIKPEFKVTEFMTSKKSYEVATMSRLVASLYGATSSTCCVEAGGGRGHLLVALCLGYKVPSLTVDCDEDKVRAAAARAKIIQKQWHAIAKRIKVGAEERLTLNKPASHQYTDLHSYDTNLNRFDTNLHRLDTDPHSSDTNLNSYDRNLNYCDIGQHCFDSNVSRTDPRSFDSNQNRSDTVLHRSDTNMHRFATAFITEDTDLAGVVAEKFPEYTGDVKLLLTGLHTCGDLGPASLRIFASRASTGAVFNVPCCYHLLTEGADGRGFPMSNYLQGYKLGRNARMLASQSIDRVVSERQLPDKSLLYRALLQMLIKTHLPNETISGGRLKRLSSKCDNFQEYFKMADAMLDLGLFDRLPQSCLIKIYNDMDCQWRKLVLFYILRLCLAQVVESVILLDRLLFLFENDFEKVYLVKLFDPVLSPRCHAIVAVR